ncbi:MAG TPA: hypothetical protein VM864_09290 [Pyrinomonadaceae bacterium]|jgi:hypothetical protein|nr:hypothetical protein [Pyrinomonadaceae bacterium]
MSVQLKGAPVAAKYYSVAGRVIAFEATEEWLSRSIESFLGGFYLHHSSRPPLGDPDCKVYVTTSPPPPLPEGYAAFETEQGVGYTNGETYHFVVNDSRIEVGPPAARAVKVWVGDTREARHPVAQVNVLSYVMHFALRRCDLYDLHAAGAVEPLSGAGALFVGNSNSGKSSLTVRLARAGWSYLSDDMLLLHELPDGVYARGLRRQFSVSAETLAGCPLPRLEEALGTPVNSDPGKRRLEPSVIFPRGFAASCRADFIFFPFVSGERTTGISRLGKAEAMVRLLKLYPWAAFDAAARTYIRFLERLLRQTQCLVLSSGRDVLADPDCAPHVLGEFINSSKP